MSFNLASLIAGTPSISKPQVSKSRDVKPSGKVQKKKSFTHGVNVIFTNGTYKGYHASVTDFFPASINLMTSGRAYIQADKYGPIVKPGSSLITEVGDSLVEQVIPPTSGEYAPIQLYKTRTDNQIRIGRVITNQNFIMRSLMKQGKDITEIQMMMDNSNNHFLTELSLFDTSLISNMTSLNLAGDEADILADKLTKMQINDETPIPLEQLSQEVKTNHSLLDKISHPEYFEYEIEVKVVFKRDLVGPQYYLNVSNNLGDIKIYNPNKATYLVSYKNYVEFRLNAVEIEKEPLAEGENAFQVTDEKEDTFEKKKEVKIQSQETGQRFRYFGVVKSGPYTGQRLEVINYTPAHLEVILSSNGKKIASHVVRKISEDGSSYIIDEYNNPVFESSMILPSHVFYMDLLLKNRNYAQVNKVLQNDSIMVLEKDNKTHTFKQSEITQNDIMELQPGFKFKEKEVTEKVTPVTLEYQEYLQGLEQGEDKEQQVYDDEQEDESQEVDYAAYSPVEDTEQPKASFKDTQRVTLVERKLTEEEKSLKTNISNILKALKMHDESIDVYTMVDNIKSLIKIIQNKLRKINYTYDLSTTNDVKFIYVCLILYELIKTGFSKNINEVVSLLFPQYFSLKDIKADAMNESIFFKQWSDDLSQESINESVNKIREYRLNENDYPKIITEILINADKIIQGILNLHINIIDRSPVKFEDLIPLGVNPLTGRRYKEEQEQAQIAKSRQSSINIKSQMVTVDDLVNNKPLPSNEVPIIWSQINIPIIEKFKQEVQKKANNQGENLKQDYLYIRDNIARAPFAIRDDPMKAPVRKAFEGIYKTLVATIIKQNLSLEKGKKRVREEQEQVRTKREEILAKRPKQDEDEEDEDIEPQHTRGYLKEQQKRETERVITRATKSANRNAYMMKKQNPLTEEKETEDVIKNDDQWWNQMDTSD